MLEPRANSPCLFLPLYEGINRSATWHPERRSSPSPGFNDYPEERAFMPYSERELATLASSGVQGKGAEEAREICLRPGCIVLGSHSADSSNSVNSSEQNHIQRLELKFLSMTPVADFQLRDHK